MNFCVITHVLHGYENQKFYAYSPYVREMNIWFKYANKVAIVAPLTLQTKTEISEYYEANEIDFIKVKSFNFKTIRSAFQSVLAIPSICFSVFKAMKNADHIHLRCPGNMGLLGSIIQMFFPSKPKTAKYAGNWDKDSKQPFSYKVQRWILSNTFLTKNMQVLVYGEWEKQSKNIKPFFTATYKESEKKPILERTFTDEISFLFVGTLSQGKQPLYAVKLVEKLRSEGKNVSLSLFGEGQERIKLEEYISNNELQDFIFLKGNQTQEVIKKAFQENHFVILPSKSEGWPKVIAEAMFWGCFPIATSVSCVASMLDKGDRGLLLSMDLENDSVAILQLINNVELYSEKVNKAVNWSRIYTLDYFENEIKMLLNT